MKKFCIVCGSNSIQISENLPLFNHNNFTTVCSKLRFRKCLSCQIIFNTRPIQKNFFSKNYYLHNKQEHKVNFFSKKKYLKRSWIVSKIIKNNTKKNINLNVLDVGCGNGELLNYLSLIYKKSTFFGYDKNVFFNKVFPKKKNFIFFNKNFDKIRSKFDIIVLSHSLFYFKNLNLFLKDLLKKITENGKIFIVIPNISKNPFYSLMGDQKVIFTKNNITNLFKLNNFKLIEINQKLLKNEHIFIGSKIKKTRFNKFRKDYTFEKSLKKIIKFKKKIQNFTLQRPIIIGTKVVAATLDEFLKKKTRLFFDMNINQKIKIFRNKPVLLLKKQKKLISVIISFNIPKNKKKIFQNNFNIKIKDYGF